MNAIFPIYTNHIKVCHLFRDEIRPFSTKFESASQVKFDVETKDIDEKSANGGTHAKDIGLDKQHDSLVYISIIFENDNCHTNPDDPKDLEA